MSTARPTFDESWYRIADLRPRLRAATQSSREVFRGRVFHLLHDPAQNEFLRVGEAGYAFIGLLEGRRTVSDAWHAAVDRLGDAAPTQGEALQLLGQLYQHNLLESDLPPDAAGLFQRVKKRTRRELGSFLMNILYAKIPLWNPDRFLSAAVIPLGWLLGPVGFALWLVLIILGLVTVAERHADLFRQAEHAIAPGNLFWLYLSTVFIRAVHEFGHGLALKRFGGGKVEVRTVGVMFMQFLPLPYMDSSASWVIQGKWKRAVVGAAGMYLELAVVAVAAMVWTRSAEGTVAHAVAYNLMFVAGISTVLFNANPLVKYDGYYMLSDILEIPNLAQKASAHLSYLVRRHLFAVKGLSDPAHTPFEKWFLLAYALASAGYRLFLTVSIALYLADQYFFLGVILAVVGLTTGLVWPIIKGARYVLTSPELARNRPRALLWTGAATVAVVLGVGVLPFPDRIRSEGVLEAETERVIHAPVDGFIAQLPTSATPVEEGAVLLELRSSELPTEREKALAECQEWRAKLAQAHAKETATAQALRERLHLAKATLAETERKLAALTVKVPCAGVWTRKGDAPHVGAFVREGEELGRVIALGTYRVRLASGQEVGGRIDPKPWAGVPVELMVRDRPQDKAAGRVLRVMPAGRENLPSPALGHPGGGELIVRANDSKGVHAAEDYFDLRIQPDRTDLMAGWLPGQCVVVRLDFGRTPLIVQGWRLLRQTLQRRFGV